MQRKRRPMIDYMDKVQKQVTTTMRTILVDWLVEVAEEYKLLSDTLHLSVSYIDRFLSVNPVSKSRLQLLGVSSMLIAAKYEEVDPPRVDPFCNITDNTYHKAETPNLQIEFLVGYLAELSLLDYDCLRFSPSIMAASVIFLARFIIWPEVHPWAASLKAVREKYKQHKFKYVANLPSPPHVPIYYFEEQ
ncbi:putative cyclin-A3-1 [Glycine max]|nr:putative cyclin-A3-1 [Glycine max]